MARTKKQAKRELLLLLQVKNQDFVVKYNENLHANRLRSRNGLRCYCIAADNGEVVCKPWYSALTSWNLRSNLLLSEINELIDQVKSDVKGLEGTDAIDEAVKNASSVIADEHFVQIGQKEVADDHDDDWYDLQEELRDAMLDAAFKVCKKYNYNND